MLQAFQLVPRLYSDRSGQSGPSVPAARYSFSDKNHIQTKCHKCSQTKKTADKNHPSEDSEERFRVDRHQERRRRTRKTGLRRRTDQTRPSRTPAWISPSRNEPPAFRTSVITAGLLHLSAASQTSTHARRSAVCAHAHSHTHRTHSASQDSRGDH